MTEVLSILESPFVLRVLLGGFLIAFVFGIMGFFTNLRKSYFYGDAIAHSSLAGIALGIYLEVEPLALAFIYAIMISILLPKIKEISKIDFNNILAIILPFSMGLGVIIFSATPGYQANLTSFLFGSMVWIGWDEILGFIVLSAIVSLFSIFSYSNLSMISTDREYSKILGLKVDLYELIYNFLLALSIILGVKLAGIVLINAFLIVPVTIAKLLSNSLKSMFLLSPLISAFSVVIGLLVSLIFNFPSGASIAVVLGLLFLITVLFKRLT